MQSSAFRIPHQLDKFVHHAIWIFFQPAAPVEKKMTAIERRSKLHGVQTYLTDEEYEMLMIAMIRTKKKFEKILHDSLIEYIKNYQ